MSKRKFMRAILSSGDYPVLQQLLFAEVWKGKGGIFMKSKQNGQGKTLIINNSMRGCGNNLIACFDLHCSLIILNVFSNENVDLFFCRVSSGSVSYCFV